MKRFPIATASAALSLAALTLAATVAPAPALAQNMEPALSLAPGSTLLTLNAEGKTSGKPDLALFTAGVVTTGKTAGEALSANSAAMNRVIQALKRAGIGERDIQTSNLGLNPVYGSRDRSSDSLEQEMPPILGYRAENTVMVKQRKIDEYGKVIDTLVAAGANQVNGPSFQIDDPDAALDQARVEAIEKARERAGLYAKAAGLRVVRVLSISEGGSYTPGPPIAYARAMSVAAEKSTPVAAGEVEVQVNVSVMYELAP